MNCPRCSLLSMFQNEETNNRECYECGFSQRAVTLDDLKNLYFRIPMRVEDGDAREGDKTNWEFYWAINYYIASKLQAPLCVAGWEGEAYVLAAHNQQGPQLFGCGNSVEEAVEQFLRLLLNAQRPAPAATSD